MRSNDTTEWLAGFGSLLACHIILASAIWLLNAGPLPFEIKQWAFYLQFAVWGIGLTQILYALPLYRALKRERRPMAIKGLVTGVVLTILLNGSCFIYIFWLLSNLH